MHTTVLIETVVADVTILVVALCSLHNHPGAYPLRLRFLMATSAMLAFCAAAKADTYQLFNLTGRLSNGAALTGTVNLDLDSSLLTDTSPFESYGDIQVTTLSGSSTSFTGHNRGIGRIGDSSSVEFFATNYQLSLAFPTVTPGAYAGYQGGNLSTYTSLYFTNGLTATSVTTYSLLYGALTPVTSAASTPEPSGLALLGTGMLGLIGAARRRSAL